MYLYEPAHLFKAVVVDPRPNMLNIIKKYFQFDNTFLTLYDSCKLSLKRLKKAYPK